MTRSDEFTSSHTLFDNPVPISCLSRTYNVQVKIAVAWEIRIDDFSQKLLVPEDTISGTLAFSTMRTLLTFSDITLVIMWFPVEINTSLEYKRKTIEKVWAAKIVSLAAFIQIRSQLFFRPNKI